MFYLIKPPSQAESRLSNFLVLLCLSIGGANLIFYYQVEIAARLYCPKKVSLSALSINCGFSYYIYDNTAQCNNIFFAKNVGVLF